MSDMTDEAVKALLDIVRTEGDAAPRIKSLARALLDARAELAAAKEREAGLRDFVDDFANAKIDALRYQPAYGESPEDEPDPVVEAETVWAWQADAKDALASRPTEYEQKVAKMKEDFPNGI